MRTFLLRLRPFVRSFDSRGYATAIARGNAYGGLGWNGDGAYVIAHAPKHAADYVVAEEGGELWVDSHVIPKGAPNPAAAHAWIDFVYKPRISAMETLYTYFGSPVRRSLLAPILAPTVLRNPDVFPPAATYRRLEPSNLTPKGLAARERIWAEVKAAQMISIEELRLAARNHAMPLEALRYPITPPGLHYLLIHYDIPAVDEATYRLEVDGLVATPLSLSLEDSARAAGGGAGGDDGMRGQRARARSSHTSSASRGCRRRWAQRAGEGRRCARSLAEAGVMDDAVELVFTGLDHGLEGGIEQAYQRSLSLIDTHRPEVLLAYEMNGAPLAPQHGFPLRLLVPGWYGMTSVKWLGRITAVDRPFEGYQQSHSYRLRQDEDETGEPLSRMLPRALMAPPGFPEFETRSRIVPAGPHLLEGRAWSGLGEVEAVTVSTDGGDSWAAAELEDDLGSQWAWRRWTFPWNPTSRRVRALLPRPRRGRKRATARAFVEPRRLREQRRPAHPRHRRRGMISLP